MNANNRKKTYFIPRYLFFVFFLWLFCRIFEICVWYIIFASRRCSISKGPTQSRQQKNNEKNDLHLLGLRHCMVWKRKSYGDLISLRWLMFSSIHHNCCCKICPEEIFPPSLVVAANWTILYSKLTYPNSSTPFVMSPFTPFACFAITSSPVATTLK